MIDNDALNKLAGYDQARLIQTNNKKWSIFLHNKEDILKDETNKALLDFIRCKEKCLLLIYISKKFMDSKMCREELDDDIYEIFATKLRKYDMNTRWDHLTEHYIVSVEKKE